MTQELYFRAALLPRSLGLLPGRPALAVALQALLFSLWHVGTFAVAPIGGAVAVLAVTFLTGVSWGWQVRRDRTIVWSGLQHVLFLAAMALFDF